MVDQSARTCVGMKRSCSSISSWPLFSAIITDFVFHSKTRCLQSSPRSSNQKQSCGRGGGEGGAHISVVPPPKTSKQRSTWSVSFMISPETSHDFSPTEPKLNTSLLQLIVLKQTHTAGIHGEPSTCSRNPPETANK